MLKKIILATLLIGLAICSTPTNSQAEPARTIAGIAPGYSFEGPDKGNMWLLKFAGVRTLAIDSTHWVYAVVQQGDVNGTDVKGTGGKVMLVGRAKGDLWVDVGLGWLSNVAEHPGHNEAGLTFDFGLLLSLTSLVTAGAHLNLVDRGPEIGATIYGVVLIDDPLKLLGKFGL